MNNCKQCGEKCKVMYCSNRCKAKYYYHNNEVKREAKIEASKKRMEEVRSENRVLRNRDLIRLLLKEHEEYNSNVDLMELYKKIYG